MPDDTAQFYLLALFALSCCREESEKVRTLSAIIGWILWASFYVPWQNPGH